MHNFPELFGVLEPYPNTMIYAVDDGTMSELIPMIINQARTMDARLDLLSTADVYEQNRQQFHDATHIFVREFKYEKPRYNVHQRKYKYIFLCTDAAAIDDLTEVCKKFYRIIKNAGHLFLLVKPTDIAPTMQALEESNFVAIGTIDILSDYTIISAKKLHGWERV
jgi:hypothetical protein